VTRKKKGVKPRKPVVRRVGTKEERALVDALDAMGPTTTQFERMFVLPPPSRADAGRVAPNSGAQGRAPKVVHTLSPDLTRALDRLDQAIADVKKAAKAA